MVTEEELVTFWKRKANLWWNLGSGWYIINIHIHFAVCMLNSIDFTSHPNANVWITFLCILEVSLMLMIRKYWDCTLVDCLCITIGYHFPLGICSMIYDHIRYQPFQTLIYQFIKKKKNDKDMKLRYIAIHHYFSTMIIQRTKDRKHLALKTLSTNHYLNEMYASSQQLKVEEVLNIVCSTANREKLLMWIVGILTMIVSNVSIIRLLFSHGIRPKVTTQWTVWLFYGKLILEIFIIICILIWSRCNAKAWIIYKRCNYDSDGRLKQFNDYYKMIKDLDTVTDKQFDQIVKVFDNQLTRYYDLWNVKYQRPSIMRMLSQRFNDDVAGLIYGYMYGEIVESIRFKYMLGFDVMESRQ